MKAWNERRDTSEMWPNAATIAAGLRVPKPYGDYLILDILMKSKGTAIDATDEEMLEATRHWAKTEGIFAAPEGAACLVAYRKLRASNFFKPEDTVVLFNTGSGLKYLDVLDRSVAPDALVRGARRTAKASPPPNRRNYRPVLIYVEADQKSLAIVTFQANADNTRLRAKLKAIPFHGICPRIR